MKICVLLPAYNEEIAISQVVADIKARGYPVVVVDDGSGDRTASLAAQAGATVLRHPHNKGKGQALRTGFAHVVRQEYEAVIVMDADGQHAAEEIPAFIEKARQSSAGIIIGNRMHTPRGMPLVRRVTNYFTSAVISGIINARVPDSQCGFRLIRRSAIEQMTLSTHKFETETEMLLEASRKGFSIESVPIRTIYAGEKSKINPLVDTIRFWHLIFAYARRKGRRGF
jgi:glycosyltransferase involved in cell wall biosynthesis